MSPLEAYYDRLPSGHQEVLLAARQWLLTQQDFPLTEALKWATPVFHHEGLQVGYLYHQKKRHLSYFALSAGVLLDHPLLQAENQKSMRYLLLDPQADLPVEAMADCLAQQIAHNRRTGKPYVVRRG